jgi:protein-tyrosine phosphatase
MPAIWRKILVVCVGNICRSPAGERLLAQLKPELQVTSAGIGALVGHDADAVMTGVAAKDGVSLDGHKARQFTLDLGRDADLILVMEPGHKAEIIRSAPQLSGKIMLFDQWTGARGIEDPYRRPPEIHAVVFRQIEAAAKAWAAKL